MVMNVWALAIFEHCWNLVLLDRLQPLELFFRTTSSPV